MLRALVLAPCLVLSASVVCQGAQILTNPNFENTPDHAFGWSFGGSGVHIEEYALPTNFMVPGNPPDGNGPWGIQIEQNGGQNFAQGNANQTVTVAPGLYNVSASALVRVFDNGTVSGQFSRARFELSVDGTVIEQIDLVNNGIPPGWTPWTVLQTSVYQVTVSSTLGVRMQLRADARDGSWAQLVADSFTLNAELIPEPATLVLACFGAVACVTTHRRRKQR